jgi:sodium/hydrogen exchanger 8
MKDDGSFSFGWEVGAFTKNDHVIVSENFLLFFTLLCGCLILQHLVGDVWKVRYVPESLVTILVAVLVGGLLRLLIEQRKEFSPLIMGFSSEIFYFGLLPPIIFNSGYHLRRRLLYGNLGAVLVLAFVGTCLSTALTSAGIQLVQNALPNAPILSVMEATAFACVIAANDPISTLAIFARLKVDPALYYAVLGESVLNDAVAITAFRVTARMIGATQFSYLDGIACVVNFFILVAGSSIIGYGVAVIVAFLFRHLHFGRNKVVPISVVICTMYIPFFLTEMLQLSGIVTIFFTGIAARR